MAEVKWIKMATDLFDNRKIKQIECLPDGDAIIVIWVKILCLAGNINDSGLVYFTKEIPYTDQMLATQFNRPITTIQLALQTFESFGMIEIVDSMIYISNWEKYQNIDRMAEIREYNRLAKQKSRERQKNIQNVNDMSMTCQSCQGTDIELEEELEKELEEEQEREEEGKEIHREKSDCQSVVNLYNTICISFPAVRALSEARKKTIKARLKNYSMTDFQTMFEKAEASSFLKGQNSHDWSATFDWMIKDSNMAKILDGNYDDRSSQQTKSEKKGRLDWIDDIQ